MLEVRRMCAWMCADVRRCAQMCASEKFCWKNEKREVREHNYSASRKVMEKFQMVKSETPWLMRNRASEPWTWPTKSHWFDREFPCPRYQQNFTCWIFSKTLLLNLQQTYNFLCSRHRIFLSNQRDLVGHVQGFDAQFLTNQGISDFAPPGFHFPANFSRQKNSIPSHLH